MGDKKAINNEKSLMQKIDLEIKIWLKQMLLHLIIMNWAERSAKPVHWTPGEESNNLLLDYTTKLSDQHTVQRLLNRNNNQVNWITQEEN